MAWMERKTWSGGDWAADISSFQHAPHQHANIPAPRYAILMFAFP